MTGNDSVALESRLEKGGFPMSAGHYKDCTAHESCWCETKRLSKLFIVTALIFAVELSVGLFYDLLPIVADAFHVLTDKIVIVIMLGTAVMLKLRPALVSERFLEIVFYVSNTILAIAMVWIGIEAVSRFSHPPEAPSGFIMALTALFGIGGNLWQHEIHEKAPDEHRHARHQTLRLHILSDLALSVAVVLGGILLSITGWVFIDPILSLVVAIWTLRLIIKLCRDQQNHHPHNHMH